PVGEPQLIDAELLDRPGRARGSLTLSLDVVVIPVLQGLLRDAEEGGGVGDVAEADQAGGLLQEAFGGMASPGEGRRGGREEAAAAGASELVGADDEFDALRPHRQVPDGAGLPAAMDRVASAVAVGTEAQGGE